MYPADTQTLLVHCVSTDRRGETGRGSAQRAPSEAFEVSRASFPGGGIGSAKTSRSENSQRYGGWRSEGLSDRSGAESGV